MTEMNSSVVLETRTITIADEELEVKPFMVGSLVRFSRELTSAGGRILAKYSATGNDIRKAKKEDLFPYMFDELDTLVGFMATAIDKDKKWLMELRDIQGFSQLFSAICELNDFRSVIENFTKGFRTISKTAEEAKAKVEKQQDEEKQGEEKQDS